MNIYPLKLCTLFNLAEIQPPIGQKIIFISLVEGKDPVMYSGIYDEDLINKVDGTLYWAFKNNQTLLL